MVKIYNFGTVIFVKCEIRTGRLHETVKKMTRPGVDSMTIWALVQYAITELHGVVIV
jgi:hypothetical protein